MTGIITGRPKIDQVVLHYIPDREKSWARLLKGETDVAGNIRPKNYDIMEQFDRLIADLQPASFLFQKIYLDAMSRRVSVKYPFSFDHPGFYRLQYARLNHE
jgi:hypothetical protein